MCVSCCFPRKRVGGLKLEELPGLEALQLPGSNFLMCFTGKLSLILSQLPMSNDVSVVGWTYIFSWGRLAFFFSFFIWACSSHRISSENSYVNMANIIWWMLNWGCLVVKVIISMNWKAIISMNSNESWWSGD